MKKVFLLAVSAAAFMLCRAQSDGQVSNPKAEALKVKEATDKSKAEEGRKKGADSFIVEKRIPATAVKNQAMTGTCWCFSTTSLIESQCMRNNLGEFDLSEMFSVRNIYFEKARNY